MCSNGAVRIAGRSTMTTGIVEVCINSTWGTICALNWTNVNSLVVCRQLGYQNGIYDIVYVQVYDGVVYYSPPEKNPSDIYTISQGLNLLSNRFFMHVYIMLNECLVVAATTTVSTLILQVSYLKHKTFQPSFVLPI